MEVRAKAPHRLVQAFTGQRIVATEWFPVPEGSEDEARRLENQGFLEVKEEKAAPKAKKAAAPFPEPVESGELADLPYKELQALASERGIPSVGVKKAELIEALSDE